MAKAVEKSAGRSKAKRGTVVEAVSGGGRAGTRRQKEEGPRGTLPSSIESRAVGCAAVELAAVELADVVAALQREHEAEDKTALRHPV